MKNPPKLIKELMSRLWIKSLFEFYKFEVNDSIKYELVQGLYTVLTPYKLESHSANELIDSGLASRVISSS